MNSGTSLAQFALLLPLDFQFENVLLQVASVVMGSYLFRQNMNFDLFEWRQ
jgi:hypothetical protein